MNTTLPTPNPSDEPRLVSASDIAELADVGPSAVSNWRKRFPDFPQPVGTGPTGGDLFDATEVDEWLRSTGRAPAERRQPQPRRWTAIEALRVEAAAPELAAIVATTAAFVRLLGDRADYQSVDPAQIVQWVRGAAAELEEEHRVHGLFDPMARVQPATLTRLLHDMREVDAVGESEAVVDLAIDRSTRYGEFRTPGAVADLMIELAQPKGIVFDPAAGSGEFLIRALQESSNVEACGQELNQDTWRIAVSRTILRGLNARLLLGDSIRDDKFEGLRADVLLCEPPWGVRLQSDHLAPGDPRWRLLGTLDAPRSGDYAWLAHAISHLAEDGRAYLLMPPGTLFRGGVEARMRAELLRQGAVEAVIAVPGGGAQTRLPSSVLWILRPPHPDPGVVLLIDAATDGVDLDTALRSRIVSAVRSFRAKSTFEPQPSFAVAVPVLELLGGDVSLMPAKWTHEPDFLEPAAALESLAREVARLKAAHDQVPAGIPELSIEPNEDGSAERFRVGELIDSGLATLVRPGRYKREQYAPAGVPVWEPADVNPSWRRSKAERFLPEAAVDSRSVTQPGDIVITTIGELRTRVDTEGGHVLGTSLHALRLDPQLFDPHVVAALLMSEQNRRLIKGTTIPRVNIEQLEFPRVDAETAARLKEALAVLGSEEAAGHSLIESAAGVRAALIEAVAAGTVRMREAP